jgi:hypothetical protein
VAFVVNLLTSVTLREKLSVGTGFFLLLYFSTGRRSLRLRDVKSS